MVESNAVKRDLGALVNGEYVVQLTLEGRGAIQRYADRFEKWDHANLTKFN